MDIYWIKDKRRQGPATVPDVISLIQMGELTPDHLGWHAGCPRWVPLRQLPALADFLDKPARKRKGKPEPEPPVPEEKEEKPAAPETREEQEKPDIPELPPAPAAGAGQNVPSGQMRVRLPSSIERLLARLVDCALYQVIYFAIIYWLQIPYEATLIPSANPLLWLPMILLEAIMLSAWGTTPGKALMGIRVHGFSPSGSASRLTFGRALMRSFWVFIVGMGLMIPILLPIGILIGYWRLHRFGLTSWDDRCTSLPVQTATPKPARHVLALVVLYISLVLVGSCMQPWYPAMLDEIAKESPGTAQTLRSLIPKQLRDETTTPAAGDTAKGNSSTAKERATGPGVGLPGI